MAGTKVPVLVTGGAGYIGSHAVLALLDAGWPVVVIDDLSTGFAWAVPEAAAFVRGDIADAALVARLIGEHGIGAILHFAGSVVVPESVARPLRYYENNTVKSRALIESALTGGVRHFIFSSTAAVYGGATISTRSSPTPSLGSGGSPPAAEKICQIARPERTSLFFRAPPPAQKMQNCRSAIAAGRRFWSHPDSNDSQQGGFAMKLLSTALAAAGLLALGACGGTATNNTAANDALPDTYNVAPDDLTANDLTANETGNAADGNAAADSNSAGGNAQ